jgi:hypothetical protein
MCALTCAAALVGAASAQEGSQQRVAAAPQFTPRADAVERENAERGQFKTLDEDTQDLKKQVLDLNRDLFLLEEELLFP